MFKEWFLLYLFFFSLSLSHTHTHTYTQTHIFCAFQKFDNFLPFFISKICRVFTFQTLRYLKFHLTNETGQYLLFNFNDCTVTSWHQNFWQLGPNMMRCEIWHHSYNLKNVKNTHGRVLLLVNLRPRTVTLLKVSLLHGCFSRSLNCTNGAKSHKPSQISSRAISGFWVGRILILEDCWTNSATLPDKEKRRTIIDIWKLKESKHTIPTSSFNPFHATDLFLPENIKNQGVLGGIETDQRYEMNLKICLKSMHQICNLSPLSRHLLISIVSICLNGWKTTLKTDTAARIVLF